MNTKGKATLQICDQKLRYFNYAESTRKTYLHYINLFLQDQDKSPAHLCAADFQTYVSTIKFSSVSQQNQLINAIRFLFKMVLQKHYGKLTFKRPRRAKRLPEVIDQEIIRTKLDQIQNLKHKALLTTAFSVGLRVSEVCNLKIADIDSPRMLINIHQGKGKKDRMVPLSQNVLDLLRQYFQAYKPKDYLFEGQSGGAYSRSSCNQLFKKHIQVGGHFHTIRHSALTAMLENGTDLRLIQNIAGHASIKTTQIYTHVSNQFLQTAALPA